MSYCKTFSRLNRAMRGWLLFLAGHCIFAGVVFAMEIPNQPWFPVAPPLADRAGVVHEVSTVEALMARVDNARQGDTILVQDGVYYLPRYIEIRADDVMLRGASGNRDAVVFDGSRSQHGELLGFRNCQGVTVAHLTIQNVKWNGFKINSDYNVQNLTIYNCVIHNIWQRGVKSVRIPEENREQIRPKNCRVQFCLFYNDRPKQFSDDPTDTMDTFKGNYIGGIDTMFAKNWVISDNVFVGIRGRTGEGRGCVFMWHHAEDCVIERNIIIDCDVGIALGNSSGIGDGQSAVHATNMVVRNNFITRTPESGILADHTQDCTIINNTIFDPGNRMNRLLRIVHSNPGLRVINNLLSGPGISVMNTEEGFYSRNVIGDFTAIFVAPQSGDLHLNDRVELIVDRGLSVPFIMAEDIDGEGRDAATDIGADEWYDNAVNAKED
jgi:hypothetical protein